MELTLAQKQPPAPEVIEHEACYIFRFPLPDSVANKLKLEIIDNELLVTTLDPGNMSQFPSFVFPRAIDAERSQAAVVRGALTVVVPKRCYTKHFQLLVEMEHPTRWRKIFNKQPYNHYFVESPRIAHPRIAFGYPERHESPVAMTTADRPECL